MTGWDPCDGRGRIHPGAGRGDKDASGPVQPPAPVGGEDPPPQAPAEGLPPRTLGAHASQDPGTLGHLAEGHFLGTGHLARERAAAQSCRSPALRHLLE